MLTDLKRRGKLIPQPAHSSTRPRGWIWRHHCLDGEQIKRANCRPLQKQSAADLRDSESDEDHSVSLSANTSLLRQAVPHLVIELTSRWQHTVNDMESESSELSSVEVIVLLLTIIKNIVYEDIKSAKEISTSTRLVPSTANILHDITCKLSLSANSQDVKGWSDRDLIVIGRCLVRVFFLMLLQIGEQNNGLTWLRQCKHIEMSIDCVNESLDTLLHDVKRRLLVTDFVSCCWLYAEGLLLRHHANTVVIGTVCRTTELIARHRGLDLTRHVLLRMSDGSSNDSLGLVISLIKLVVAVCRLLKLMRSRYVHCCTCSRTSHRHCNVSSHRSIYHHHHDALGTAVCSTSSQTPRTFHASTLSGDWHSSYCTLPDSCVVSSLAVFLLGLFHHIVDSQVKLYLLDVFDEGVVTCCCLPVDLLVATFIGACTSSLSCRLRIKSVGVLVNILLYDCGGNATIDCCNVCNNAPELSSLRTVTSFPDSALSGCKTSDSSSVCRWKCLSQFAEMVCTGDSAFTIHVSSQAARLANCGCDSLKQELYYRFFVPLLVTLVHQLTACRYSDNTLPVVLSVDVVPLAVKISLSALSSILTSFAMLRQFVSVHGIDMICKLANVDATRCNALSLLEVLVNVENTSSERSHTVHELRMPPVGNNESADDSRSAGALDAFVQLLFEDWNDVQWSANLRENLQSPDFSIGRMLAVWHVACRLVLCNGLFHQRFVALNGPQLAYMLLVSASDAFLALDCGPSITDIRVTVFSRQAEQSHVHERSLLFVIRSALSVCLRCCNHQQVNTFIYLYHFASDRLTYVIYSRISQAENLAIISDPRISW